MMAIDPNVDLFLRQTLVAVLGTTNESESPHLVPVWFTWENGAAYMVTDRKSTKWRNILAQPYASLCVDDRHPPYSGVILSGPVEEVDRPVYEIIRSMALRYLGEKEGEEFANLQRMNGIANNNNSPSGVVFRLTPDNVVRIKNLKA